MNRNTLLTVLTLNACSGGDGTAEFEDAQSIEPMACATHLSEYAEEHEDEVISSEIALTRNGYSNTISQRNDGSYCHVQPYVAYSPSSVENLSSENLQNWVDTRLVGMAYPEEETLGSAMEAERLAEVKLSTDCAQFGNESGAPVCALTCPSWIAEEPTSMMMTDLCERVVAIDDDSVETFGTYGSETDASDTGSN